jgi:hypothetical protein
MDINRMRLGLIYIFSESALSPKSKLELIKFIEQADKHQLQTLALSGEIVAKNQLFGFVRKLTDERFSEEVEIQDKLKHASTLALIKLAERKAIKK